MEPCENCPFRRACPETEEIVALCEQEVGEEPKEYKRTPISLEDERRLEAFHHC